ncbi:helix-turn-helix domain-containing protein [Roseibium sp.]|uniref:helix-turn-helix domain-containing protein n=1 Tax=Roseibium sp. TaxID=1936156 RepID=UPI003D101AC2
MKKQRRSLTRDVPAHERRFYGTTNAFGRFGMRTFHPVVMKQPHWHGHVEANIISGATMTYEVDNKTVEIPENRFVIFWAGVPHQLTAIHQTGPDKPTLTNLYIPVDTFLFLPHISRLQIELLSGALVALPEELCSNDKFLGWYRDYRSHDFERLEIMKMELNALLRRALTCELTYLREPITEPGSNRDLTSAHIGHVVEMVRFILENVNRPITNADVAAVTGLHENYATTLFSKIMRIPVKRFIIRMRLLRARAQLIESATAISVVAENSGFSSISQFYDHFKSAYGMSPHAMRRRYAEKVLR